MALVVRIDVDRPYGRQPVLRHALSRIGSDLYFPRIERLGYLRELRAILDALAGTAARAHVFFRRCTLPSDAALAAIRDGRHVIGLHLEDSRSFESFAAERAVLERHAGTPVRAVSKHGSGRARYGRRHYAPYEPDRYADWARRSGMNLFLGNGEDPTTPSTTDAALTIFPAAFWLEPAWRDTARFPVGWLLEHAATIDTVLLLHPENVLAVPALRQQLDLLVRSLPTKVYE
jgi:hypothetical protein